MVAFITFLLAIIYGLVAAQAGLGFYQGFFAVVVGLIGTWFLVAFGFLVFWRLISGRW